MKCARCEQEFEHPDTNICGNCADDLRVDEEAELMATIGRDEEIARQQYEDAERRAYDTEQPRR